jgi:hypothetical protein
MRGVITNREVVANFWIVLNEFGLACIVRCAVAALKGRRTTFLDLALKHDAEHSS